MFTLSSLKPLVTATWLAATGFLAAQDLIVTTAADELNSPAGSNLSLREAIRDANAGDTITFDPSLSGATINLNASRGELKITKALTIDASALPNGITIDGGSDGDNLKEANETRCFVIDDENDNNLVTVRLEGLRIQNGVTEVEGAVSNDRDNGANIFNLERLTLDNCKIRDGRVEGLGAPTGGIYCKLGSRLTVRNCLFANNTDEGINFQNAASTGGAVFLEIEGSTFVGNTGTAILAIVGTSDRIRGGATLISNTFISGNKRGIESRGGDLRVTNSSIVSNNATGSSDRGAGILFASAINPEGFATMDLLNCTIAGNSATREGGGILHQGRFFDGPISTITNCTIIGNSGSNGGGIIDVSSRLSLRIVNSLVIGNDASGSGDDINGSFGNGGGNIIGLGGNPLSTFVETSGNSPIIGNNGGPTSSIQLATGSPAIDAGSNAELPDDVATDLTSAGSAASSGAPSMWERWNPRVSLLLSSPLMRTTLPFRVLEPLWREL